MTDTTRSPVQVVYAVTDRHMCKLSSLSAGVSWEMDLGEARLLEAICPTVWPDMRLRIEERAEPTVLQSMTGGEFTSRLATVRALWEFKPVVKALVTEDWALRKLRDAQVHQDHTSRRLGTLRSEHLNATSGWLSGSRPMWATSREEAEQLLRDGYRKEWGLEIEIHWGDPLAPMRLFKATVRTRKQTTCDPATEGSDLGPPAGLRIFTTEVKAVDRDAAERIIRDEHEKQGVKVEIHWGEADKA